MIADGLYNNISVDHLDLSHNSIEDAGANQLALTLSKNRNLKHIDIS